MDKLWIDKRRLLKLGAGIGGLAVAGGGAIAIARARGKSAYRAAADATWRPVDPAGDPPAILRELVRCATLAANSHNTQPWRFAASERGIEIGADPARRLAAVDPDDHHLYISLGCAAENVAQAAPAGGLRATPRFEAGTARVQIDLEPAPDRPGDLIGAIARRQSTRADYDGRQVPAGDLALLAAAARGSGVTMQLFTDRAWLDRLLPLLLTANAAQMGDPAFMAELKAWVRFGYADALATRDGLFTAASGNPVIAAMLGRRLFDMAVTAAGENDVYARQLRSTPAVAVFAGAQADPAHWFAVGRCFQRFALQATALGLRLAMLNQPVEVASARGDLAALAGIAGQRPDLVVRFGYGPDMPRSLRRPIGAVMTA